VGKLKYRLGCYLFLLPAIIYICLLLIYPLIYNIELSFRDVSLISYMRGTSKYLGLGNYQKLFRDPIFHRILCNTAIFMVLSIVFQFVLGLLLALLFNRDFPLNNIFQGLILLPWFVPIMVKGNIFRWFFSDMGTINGFLSSLGIISHPIPWITSKSLPIISLSIANIWLGIPFNFILLYTGLKAIPVELYECAQIDGARQWHQTIYITLPLLKPVIVTTLMLGSIFTIKVFDLVWIITKGGPGNISHLFSTYSYALAMEQFKFGMGAAVAIVMVLIVTAITIGFHCIKVDY
jgi:multiple sugar transport system permease protein